MKRKAIFIGFFGLTLLCGGLLLGYRSGYFSEPLPSSTSKDSGFSTDGDTDIDNSGELFGRYYVKAQEVLSNMSIEEKVGQLFLVRYDHNTVDNQITNYYPGGYILFAKDFQDHDKDSILQELDNNQKISKIPLVFGVDEEGGIVTRVSRYPQFRSEKFKSPQELYSEGGYELLEATEKEKAELLLSLGLNFNLAPVADVSVDSNDFIYNRTFGKNAEDTAMYIKNMVNYSKKAGISSCLKHFPGYGNNVDTHTGSAYDNRSYENFVNNDYLPFRSGIDAGVPTILVSHNVVSAIDSDYPASLSSNMIKELREKLKFSGVIITDDLAMDAVKNYVENKNAAVLAINAGNDMIITSDFETMYEEVLTAVNSDIIKEETVNKAVRRIIAWKYEYNLI